jgi:hypothetical protein
MNRRVTIKNINAALKAKGYEAELVRGNLYFYFVGIDTSVMKTQGVYTYKLSAYSVLDWVNLFEEMKKSP